MDQEEERRLRARVGDSPVEALHALLEAVEWMGVSEAGLPQRAGFSPEVIAPACLELEARGDLVRIESALFSGSTWQAGKSRILEELETYHRDNPLRPGRPLEELRQVVPGPMGAKLGEAALQALAGEGEITLGQGLAALKGFTIQMSEGQRKQKEQLKSRILEAGLTPPTLRELAEEVGPARELQPLLKVLEAEGLIVALEDELYFPAKAVHDAGVDLVMAMGGAHDLGPAEFRDVLDLTRKHLLPLLRHFDTVGITTRREERRTVAKVLPEGWGT
jgi:selenocysteine-specific elongation factor